MAGRLAYFDRKNEFSDICGYPPPGIAWELASQGTEEVARSGQGRLQRLEGRRTHDDLAAYQRKRKRVAEKNMRPAPGVWMQLTARVHGQG